MSVANQNITKMLYLNRSRELLFKSFNLTTRHCTNPANKYACAQNRIKFFTKLLELPKTAETEKLLKKKKLRLSRTEEDVKNSFKFLVSIGATVEDVRKQANLLNYRESTLRNRYEILLECGCPEVNAFYLNSYLKIVNETELALKKDGIIPHNVNLQDRLAQILNVKSKRIGDEPLKKIRCHMLKLFCSQNGIVSFEEFDKLSKHYGSVKHKSYRSSKEIVELALDHIKMSKEKLKNNFFVLSADPGNVRKLLSMKHIGGVEMEKILRDYPKVMDMPYEFVQKTLSYIKDFGFSEEAVTKSFWVLFLNPETVYARLVNLNKVRELQVMKDHPRVLNLIKSSSMIAARMKYLKVLNVKCISLSVLTGPASHFVRYGRQGEDKNVARHCLSFLANIFNKDKTHVREEIRRHPYWLQISISDIKETIDELQKAGFSLEDIYSNIHIVLYSPQVIFDRLKILKETEQIEGVNITNLAKSTQLKMVLYAIELDYHFTGDGVWENRITVDRLTLSNSEVPDIVSRSKLKRILDRET